MTKTHLAMNKIKTFYGGSDKFWPKSSYLWQSVEIEKAYRPEHKKSRMSALTGEALSCFEIPISKRTITFLLCWIAINITLCLPKCQFRHHRTTPTPMTLCMPFCGFVCASPTKLTTFFQKFSIYIYNFYYYLFVLLK